MSANTAATNRTVCFRFTGGGIEEVRGPVVIGSFDARRLAPNAFVHVADETGKSCASCGADLFPDSTPAQRDASPGWAQGHPILLLFDEGNWTHSIDLSGVAACWLNPEWLPSNRRQR